MFKTQHTKRHQRLSDILIILTTIQKQVKAADILPTVRAQNTLEKLGGLTERIDFQIRQAVRLFQEWKYKLQKQGLCSSRILNAVS